MPLSSSLHSHFFCSVRSSSPKVKQNKREKLFCPLDPYKKKLREKKKNFKPPTSRVREGEGVRSEADKSIKELSSSLSQPAASAFCPKTLKIVAAN